MLRFEDLGTWWSTTRMSSCKMARENCLCLASPLHRNYGPTGLIIRVSSATSSSSTLLSIQYSILNSSNVWRNSHCGNIRMNTRGAQSKSSTRNFRTYLHWQLPMLGYYVLDTILDTCYACFVNRVFRFIDFVAPNHPPIGPRTHTFLIYQSRC